MVGKIKTVRTTGYGVPQERTPRLKKKPDNLPTNLKQWLDTTEKLEQSSKTPSQLGVLNPTQGAVVTALQQK